MPDCLFCRIIARELPSKILDEDDQIVVVEDINKQAPLHALLIPRQHIATTNDLTAAEDALVGTLVRRAALLARQHGYHERGYRTVFNCNREAGQSVFHIHLPLLAGRPLGWPPG